MRVHCTCIVFYILYPFDVHSFKCIFITLLSYDQVNWPALCDEWTFAVVGDFYVKTSFRIKSQSTWPVRPFRKRKYIHFDFIAVNLTSINGPITFRILAISIKTTCALALCTNSITGPIRIPFQMEYFMANKLIIINN